MGLRRNIESGLISCRTIDIVYLSRNTDHDTRINAMKDVEYHIGSKIHEHWAKAMLSASMQAIAGGSCNLDVVIYSEEGARLYGGDDAAERYLEDPEASVFERFEVRVNCVGRVP